MIKTPAKQDRKRGESQVLHLAIISVGEGT